MVGVVFFHWEAHSMGVSFAVVTAVDIQCLDPLYP